MKEKFKEVTNTFDNEKCKKGEKIKTSERIKKKRETSKRNTEKEEC